MRMILIPVMIAVCAGCEGTTEGSVSRLNPTPGSDRTQIALAPLMDGGSSQAFGIDVMQTGTGALWWARYSALLVSADSKVESTIEVNVAAEDTLVGEIDIATQHVTDLEGQEVRPTVVYSEKPAEGEFNDSVYWIAARGTLQLERTQAGLRLTCKGVELVPRGPTVCIENTCHDEPLAANDKREPLMLDGAITGEFDLLCSVLVDGQVGPDDKFSSEFCKANDL